MQAFDMNEILYEELKEENAQLKEENNRLREENKSLKARIDEHIRNDQDQPSPLQTSFYEKRIIYTKSQTRCIIGSFQESVPSI